MDIPHFTTIYSFSKIEFAIAIVTLLSVLFFGALEGIVIGVDIVHYWITKKYVQPPYCNIRTYTWYDQFLDIKRRPESEIISHTLIVRVDGSQIFLNTDSIKNTIIDLVDNEYKDTKLFVLDFEASSFIDYTGIEMLEELYDELK